MCVISPENYPFSNRKIFHLHFFTEEENIIQIFFVEIKLLTMRVDFKWENDSFMQNREVMAYSAKRATTK